MTVLLPQSMTDRSKWITAMPAVPTVLVVEAEFLIALDIQRVLETLDVCQTLFARSADEARLSIESWPQLALAILDVRAGEHATFAVARELMSMGIPVILTSADIGLRAGVPDLPGVTVIVKPLQEAELVGAIGQALGAKR